LSGDGFLRLRKDNWRLQKFDEKERNLYYLKIKKRKKQEDIILIVGREIEVEVFNVKKCILSGGIQE
jgi:hypothetical protein